MRADFDRWLAEVQARARQLKADSERFLRSIDAQQSAIGKGAKEAYALGRSEALEEAAVMMEREMEEPICAAAIRALKEKKG